MFPAMEQPAVTTVRDATSYATADTFYAVITVPVPRGKPAF